MKIVQFGCDVCGRIIYHQPPHRVHVEMEEGLLLLYMCVDCRSQCITTMKENIMYTTEEEIRRITEPNIKEPCEE